MNNSSRFKVSTFICKYVTKIIITKKRLVLLNSQMTCFIVNICNEYLHTSASWTFGSTLLRKENVEVVTNPNVLSKYTHTECQKYKHYKKL